ncbi:DUF6580 family putative transport protein [Rhodopirellula sallentina]|uniref:Putative membrane protein n=1 Tax=Rhodopirellula sallentina SM41 TaxID=1263870 RepID=M5U874_9BACT|nr:DUF6580 family putative transport protein [Rhodopirellula sallentina]EMI57479.1 putative membrane protein [Rhodopirellula sallentina SM41]
MNTITARIRRSLSAVSASQATLVGAAVVVAVASRLLPHPPNFTPMAAIGIFAGAVCLRPAIAAAVIVGSMLISDMFLGFHPLMPVIYGCLLMNLVIGARFVRGANGLSMNAASCGRIVTGSLIGSVLFFLTTNFAHYVSFYPPTLEGLVACYTAAIPFFQFTLSGDLVYTGVLFGAYALVGVKSGARATAMVAAR